MELTYDWKSFQSFFYKKRRQSQLQEGPQKSRYGEPVYVVMDQKQILAVHSETGDFSKWVGTTLDELVLDAARREVICVERSELDQCLSTASGLPHFYEQTEWMKQSVTPKSLLRDRLRKKDIFKANHFLLLALQGWWQRLFPRHYGIYLKISHARGYALESSLFFKVHQGRLKFFGVPHLSGMIPERQQNLLEATQFLASHYRFPVQGVQVTASEWADWSESQRPWKQVAAALKKDKTKLAPARWGLRFLIQMRAWWGV